MPDKGVVLTPEQQRRRRARNLAIAAALVGMVVLFYILTLARLGGNVAERGM